MYVASRNVDIDIGPEGAVCGHVIGAARGADVLSHECTFRNEEAEKAVVAMHSTAAMAGSFARHLGCAHSPCTAPTTGPNEHSNGSNRGLTHFRYLSYTD